MVSMDAYFFGCYFVSHFYPFSLKRNQTSARLHGCFQGMGKVDMESANVYELQLTTDDAAGIAAQEWFRSLSISLPEDRLADLRLLAHELVTNSIRHSRGKEIWITVLDLPEGVRVQVTDDGHGSAPNLVEVKPLASSGRGLRWVSNLSDHWNIDQRRPTSVWFQIDSVLRQGGGHAGKQKTDRRSEEERQEGAESSGVEDHFEVAQGD
jgi:anti-sigma regulatory factor (Ser/Thr protein kinase)